jgi:hypothetical protein
MKGPILLILILPLLFFGCDSDEITSLQSESFIKYYNLNPVNTAAGVYALPDGGYAVLGNTQSSSRKMDICLMLLDEYGNSIQEPKYFGNTRNDWGHCIKEAPDGGFIILGSTETSDNNLDVYLIKTNAQGDTSWTRVFNKANGSYPNEEGLNDEGLYFDFDNNGNIMMVGYSYTAKYSKQIWIYDVDQNGNRFDSHSPKVTGGGSGVDQANFVTYVGDGFLITGVSNLQDKVTPSQFSFIILLKSYTNPTAYEFPDPDGNATQNEMSMGLTYINSDTLMMYGTINNSAGGTDAYLSKIINTHEHVYLPTYEVAWQRHFTNDVNNMATGMLISNNNIYILSSMSNIDKSSSTISIIKTDLAGLNPEYLQYGGSTKMESQMFDLSADGGFIIAGTNGTKDYSSMILIKTKAGGKL